MKNLKLSLVTLTLGLSLSGQAFAGNATAPVAVRTIPGINISGQALPGNCSTMLDDLMNWAKEPIFGEKYISVTMTSNVNTRKFASYTVGSLDYLPPLFLLTKFIPERLSGEGKSYFSDRTWTDVPPGGCSGLLFCGTQEPFNPKATDKVRITLKKHPTNNTLANVNLTLLSWGNAQVNFNASCDKGHIYGFKADHHGTHLYDLTFKKEQIFYPK